MSLVTEAASSGLLKLFRRLGFEWTQDSMTGRKDSDVVQEVNAKVYRWRLEMDEYIGHITKRKALPVAYVPVFSRVRSG
mgnify:CR=1 FL=1